MAKDIDTKIDELATMVARGFASTATKDDVKELHERIESLENKVGSIEENMATRNDVDKFVGTVRADYDSLAARVKDVEKIALS